jgi:hypothetical protein
MKSFLQRVYLSIIKSDDKWNKKWKEICYTHTFCCVEIQIVTNQYISKYMIIEMLRFS